MFIRKLLFFLMVLGVKSSLTKNFTARLANKILLPARKKEARIPKRSAKTPPISGPKIPPPAIDAWIIPRPQPVFSLGIQSDISAREPGIKPELPKTATFLWPQAIGMHGRLYTVLSILNHLMRQVSPHTSWDRRLGELLSEFSEISQPAMGFPPDWQADPFWHQ